MRTYKTKVISIPEDVHTALEEKKIKEGRKGSLTAFAAEILHKYAGGDLVEKELLRAQIEAEIRTKLSSEVLKLGKAEILGMALDQKSKDHPARGKRNAA